MKLKQAGLELLKNYILDIQTILKDAAKKHEKSDPGKYSFIAAQCQAAIRIAQNLCDHLPLEGSGLMQMARNTARLAQLALGLRPEGGYSRDYKLLKWGFWRMGHFGCQ